MLLLIKQINFYIEIKSYGVKKIRNFYFTQNKLPSDEKN
jgi:hypothetical protein